ncbi:MAG: TfoX/Sxy family protein [Flavobacteriales bacterium]|nr:TfoX/Sxy family protein [Flavobacteriales bacterium]
MAYDEFLGDRIRQIIESMHVDFFEKKMMGGLIFMVNDKMFCGIHFSKKTNTNLLMARIGLEATAEALIMTGCHPMDFTGRPMKGFVFITPDGFDTDDDLEYWLKLCLAFNPEAKAAKKRI